MIQRGIPTPYFAFLAITVACLLTAQDSVWSISTVDAKAEHSGITTANGNIGLVMDTRLFKTKDVILGGQYEKGPDNGISRVLKGFDFLNLEVFINRQLVDLKNSKNWKQTLDLKTGTIQTEINHKDTQITHRIYAHRALPYAAMAELDVVSKSNIELEVRNPIQQNEQLKDVKYSFRELEDMGHTMQISQAKAKTLFGKHEVAAASTFLFVGNESPKLTFVKNSLGFKHKLEANKSFSCALAGGITTTAHFKDALNEAERQPIYILIQGLEETRQRHIADWNGMWENDIIIEGDIESQRDVRLALYHLFAFARAGSRQSIAPMGLSAQGYNGHIFWDTELWMYPVFAVFDQEIAKTLLDYRVDRLDKAKQKANVYGYKGAMFPWESDDTGEEATPTWALTGTAEHHITADVAIAFWNYYRITKDKRWLANTAFQVLKETADFWVSRVHTNQDGTYSITNVVGADEYAQNVTDNAFTNAAAKQNLRIAQQAAEILNEPANPEWERVAKGIRILTKDGITQEYEGYKGEVIKQADVNLLAFPLDEITDPVQIKADLDYYISKVDPDHGPAMAHGIFSLLYARIGDVDKAFKSFKKAYIPNKRPPFGVLSETAKANNPYFATGAGAMLQAVLFGFGGLDISDSGLTRNKGILPNKWKSLTLKGVGINNETIKVIQ